MSTQTNSQLVSIKFILSAALLNQLIIGVWLCCVVIQCDAATHAAVGWGEMMVLDRMRQIMLLGKDKRV